MINEKELAESIIKSSDIIIERYHELDPHYCIGALSSYNHIMGVIIKGMWNENILKELPKSCFDCHYCGKIFENHYFCCGKCKTLPIKEASEPCIKWKPKQRV